MADAVSGVVVTPKPLGDNPFANPQEMLCIPWTTSMAGCLANASRVKADVREKLIAYQRDCYRVLARHFTAVSTFSSTGSTLAQAQVRAMGLAIAQMAERTNDYSPH
ncbi:MAG: hypothetical protein IPK53_09670 [bacterium]|nr:hypothetical protein [bacterium]